MIYRLVASSFILTLAFVILSASVLRAASVRYEFGGLVSGNQLGIKSNAINYPLPKAGSILPNHPLWAVKAMCDRAWLLVTVNDLKKAEILLHLSDKRLSAAVDLFSVGDFETGVSVLTKAEKYLEEAAAVEKIAREDGMETGRFLERMTHATLKHQETIVNLISQGPEDARPVIIKTGDYSIRLYQELRGLLTSLGRVAPENPFFQ